MKKYHAFILGILIIAVVALSSCTGARFASGKTGCAAILKQKLVGY